MTSPIGFSGSSIALIIGLVASPIACTPSSTTLASAVPISPIGRTTSLTTSSITPKSILVLGKSIEPSVPPSLIYLPKP